MDIMYYLSKKNLFFQKEYSYPFYIFLIALLIIFSRLSGSIEVWDEAIYSQIAKEGFLRDEWLTLYYNGDAWFEKPPLVIWLTIVSFKIFGVNEFALWFFPAAMGTATVACLYFLGKELFNFRTGILSALVLLSIPHFLLISRNNTMDIFLTGFSLFSMLFLARAPKNEKNLLGCFFFLGLAFMSKSVASLLMVPVFAAYIYKKKEWKLLKSRFLYQGIGIFLLITMPWHIYMVYSHGMGFLGSYMGYHIFARYSTDILGVGHSKDVLFYPRILLKKLGSYWFVFIALLPIIYSYIKEGPRRKEAEVTAFWAFFILAAFSLSSTKLEQYIVPFYVPFALLLGLGLCEACKNKNVLLSVLAPLAVVINLSSHARTNAAYSGEAEPALSGLLMRIFDSYSILLFLSVLSYLLVFFVFFQKRKSLASQMAIVLIIFSGLLFPLSPDRNMLAKEIGEKVKKNPVIQKIYIADYFRQHNFDVVLSYYIFPSETEFLDKRNYSREENSAEYCLINLPGYDRYANIVYDFFPCKLAE